MHLRMTSEKVLADLEQLSFMARHCGVAGCWQVWRATDLHGMLCCQNIGMCWLVRRAVHALHACCCWLGLAAVCGGLTQEVVEQVVSGSLQALQPRTVRIKLIRIRLQCTRVSALNVKFLLYTNNSILGG
jgi:hypothetical protein